MALTLPELQKIEKVGLDGFYAQHQAAWVGAFGRARSFLRDTFPAGAAIRPDDVYPVLLSAVEADVQLQAYLADKKLTQQYWFKYYCHYVIDSAW